MYLVWPQWIPVISYSLRLQVPQEEQDSHRQNETAVSKLPSRSAPAILDKTDQIVAGEWGYPQALTEIMHTTLRVTTNDSQAYKAPSKLPLPQEYLK
jgi:hypothetical protein